MGLMDIDAVDWWTFDLVREALIETAVLWRRSPGGGRWPFASDAPWHLMSRDVQAGDYDARGGFDVSSDVAVRPLPLGQADIARRNTVSEWPVRFVADANDRRLLGVCLEFHALGYTQLPWGRIMARIGVKRGKEGLKKRYRAALRAIAEGLNTAEILEGNVSRGGM